MKKLEKKSNWNLFTIILGAGLTFSLFALMMSCGGPKEENTSDQDSIDSAKTTNVAPMDSLAGKDSTTNM